MLVGRAASTTGVLLPNLWDAAMAALNSPTQFVEDEESLTLGRVRIYAPSDCQGLDSHHWRAKLVAASRPWCMATTQSLDTLACRIWFFLPQRQQ